MSFLNAVVDAMKSVNLPTPPAPPTPTELKDKFLELFGEEPPEDVKKFFNQLEALSPQELWNQLTRMFQVLAQKFDVRLDMPVPAFDVNQALNELAKGINAAESTLRSSQFSIVGGAAQLELKLKLPGISDGPSARLNLQIAPRPHP